MKHCVHYPDDKFLAVRPCLVAICLGNRPAAKLLGTLLYRYNLRIENKDDAENQNAVKAAKGEKPDQDTTYRIFRKQSQLVEDMCGEMTEKTLHDVAVPMLQLLGFIGLEEHMSSNCYIVDIERVQQALNLSQDEKQLEMFLISTIQLEMFLITPDELEMFLIDKKHFLSGLEKVLIYNRNISNHKRGRKVTPEAVSSRVLRRTQNLKEITKKNKKNTENVAQLANAVAQETRDDVQAQAADDGRRDDDGRRTATPHDLNSPLNGGLHSPAVSAGNTPGRDPADVGRMPPQKARTRKPKVTDEEKARRAAVATEEQGRVADVFTAFDSLAREMYRDPDFSYDRSKAATEAIRQFLTLTPRPTLEKLRTKYVELFNKPRSRDGFCWQDNMSIAAVCREYGRKPVLAAAKPSVAPSPGTRFVPEETDLMKKLRLMREEYGPKELAGTGGRA